MTTQTHTPVVATRGRRTLGGARPGSTVPTHIAMRLRGVTDGAEQLGAIAHHTLPELIGKIAWQVGHAKAEDLAMDVIERHLAEHRKNPRDSYHHIDEYHRLRASLIRSTVNASIDHLRRKSTRVEMPVGSFFDDGDHDMAVAGGDLPIDECDEALHRRVAQQREVDVLRAPRELVILPRVRAGLHGDEPVPALGVGEGAADAVEVGIERRVVVVARVVIAPRGVRLPDLDQRVADRTGVGVQHPDSRATQPVSG